MYSAKILGTISNAQLLLLFFSGVITGYNSFIICPLKPLATSARQLNTILSQVQREENKNCLSSGNGESLVLQYQDSMLVHYDFLALGGFM